jgi:hypothetical protein
MEFQTHDEQTQIFTSLLAFSSREKKNTVCGIVFIYFVITVSWNHIKQGMQKANFVNSWDLVSWCRYKLQDHLLLLPRQLFNTG